MKKRFALAAAFTFSIIPLTSLADHLNVGEGYQFIELMLAGDLSHRDLEGVNFRYYDREGYLTTTGADFSNANLKDADLEGLNLINVDFSSANLRNTNLADTNLTGADFDKASLVYTKLTNANLTNASLNTFITSINDLSNVKLTGADLSGAILGTDFDGFDDIRSCPGKMPSGWYCENNTFRIGESSNEIEVEDRDIDIDSITVKDLPYSVDCPPKNKDLKIKQNKKEKFVVRFASGKRFYRGLDFDEALEVFEETYEDKCVE